MLSQNFQIIPIFTLTYAFANNPGSVANNVGLNPLIDVDNSGPKSRCLQVEAIINAGRYS
jgi:hypothetical protein